LVYRGHDKKPNDLNLLILSTLKLVDFGQDKINVSELLNLIQNEFEGTINIIYFSKDSSQSPRTNLKNQRINSRTPFSLRVN
jgi:hypothetical protein